jgi:hypothetical protein
VIKGENVKYMKAQRIIRWGNLKRMEDIKLVKMFTDWNPLGVRSKGRRKDRWRDEVINYLEMV